MKKTDAGNTKIIPEEKSDKVEEIKCTASTPRKESDDCNKCADKSPCVPCIMIKIRGFEEEVEEDNDKSIIVTAIDMDRNNGCK